MFQLVSVIVVIPEIHSYHVNHSPLNQFPIYQSMYVDHHHVVYIVAVMK